MWPQWSAWTWWAVGTSLLPLLAVPALYDLRHSLLTRFRNPLRGIRLWWKLRMPKQIVSDMHELLKVLGERPSDARGQYRQLNRVAMLLDKYPEWFPEDTGFHEIRDRVDSILMSLERRMQRVIDDP